MRCRKTSLADHLVSTVLVCTGLAVSVASTPAFAISEAGYLGVFENTVMPFYRSGIAGEFAGTQGVRISYRVFPATAPTGEKGAIVFCLGRGESYLTYPELEYDLSQAGYSVYVMDPRSQGFSGRTAADHQVVTVPSFDVYVADLAMFIDSVVRPAEHANLFMLTNSMGGLVGAHYLATHPKVFERAALSVPMFEINTGKIPEPIALKLAGLEILLGHGDEYATLGGQKPYDFSPRHDCNSSDGHEVRRCEIDALVRANPESASGGSSYRWVHESLIAARKLRDGMGSHITIPTLVFQAGRDELVLPGGQNLFCRQAPHCRMEVFPGSTHGLLTEKDEFRAAAVRSIVEFF